MRNYTFETACCATGQVSLIDDNFSDDAHIVICGTVTSGGRPTHDTVTITVVDHLGGFGDDLIVGWRGDDRNYLAWNQAPRAPRRRK